MTAFDWKIPETVIEDGVLKSVKYRVKAVDGKFSVETEGYWKMRTQHQIPEDVSEKLVAHWLDLDTTQDDRHLIKSRLQEQLDALKSAPSTKPPWAVDTFKVTI
jgi:uncharacterized coiled-coil protein SlyX